MKMKIIDYLNDDEIIIVQINNDDFIIKKYDFTNFIDNAIEKRLINIEKTNNIKIKYIEYKYNISIYEIYINENDYINEPKTVIINDKNNEMLKIINNNNIINVDYADSRAEFDYDIVINNLITIIASMSNVTMIY